MRICTGYTRARVYGNPTELSWVDKKCSYWAAGAEYTPAFQEHRWTGHIHLFRKTDGSMPAGLAAYVAHLGRASGFDVTLEDCRTPLTPARTLEEAAPFLRDYQMEAAAKILHHTRGIVGAATGTGKTAVMVGVALAAGVPTLVLVHTKDLLRQTREMYARFASERAGAIGDGEFDVRGFTVATVQTLYRRRQELQVKQYLDSVRMLLVDECFPAGTLIGSRPIECVRIGTIVPSITSEGVLTYRKVTRVFKRRPVALVRVHTKAGDFVCTPGHPVRTTSGWVPAALLAPGSTVLHIALHEMRSVRAVTLRAAQSSRPEKGRRFAGVRVVSTTILEPGRDGRFGGMCPDGYVYNLEVAGTHAYVANGFAVHNCHRCASRTVTAVANATRHAYWRCGFSGTPTARGSGDGLVVVGALGPLIYKYDAQTAVQDAVLAKPVITFVRNSDMRAAGDRGTWAAIYDAHVTHNDQRNRVIRSTVAVAAKPCLVFVRVVEHGRVLKALLEAAGWRTEFVWGQHTSSIRQYAASMLDSGATQVTIASVIWNEGIDLPHLRSVIVAAGGKSPIQLMQRLGRGMRRVSDKTDFEVYDIMDMSHTWLTRHALARAGLFRRAGFDVRVVAEQALVSRGSCSAATDSLLRLHSGAVRNEQQSEAKE